MDNLKDEENNDILGLFQESYNPIGLHADGGFNLNEIIFKQTLIPLTSKGSTVIFKNKFYGNSTNFTIDENELKIKDNQKCYKIKLNHPLSHLNLDMKIKTFEIDKKYDLDSNLEYKWIKKSKVNEYAMPTPIKKVVSAL